MSALHDFVSRYGPAAGEEGPVLFVREVFGVALDPWQEEVLRAFGRGERGVAVQSCHGPGKTATAAWLVWLHLLTRLPQKAVATAPTSAQLEGALLPEIKMWGGRLPPVLQELFEIKAHGIYLKAAPSESFFEARTSRAEKPEALQGIHSEHVLLIADEASGVPEAVFEAAIGSMSGEHATTLLIGNPVRSSGFFYDTFHKMKDRWFTVKVGYMDSARVSAAFVEDVRRRYGEDSNAFRVRCLGEFPKSDDDTVIPFEWVEAARERDIVESATVRRVWGLDVARFGADKTALVERTNRSAKVLSVWANADLMETSGRIKSLWADTPAHMRPVVILVDVIGLGSGVVDRLRELGLPVRGVNVGETAALNEKFVRARSELWWTAREWLERKDVRLEQAATDDPEDPQEILASELVVPRYQYTSAGKIQVESKDSLKARGHKSPDVADAFVLTFAEDLTSAVYGTAGSATWGAPIKRGLAVV
jgi:phage terminase large subunit